MDTLFVILFSLSFIALIIGLIKPDIVLRMLPVAKRTRKFVLIYFGIATVLFFILIGVTAPPISESEANVERIEQEEKAEKIMKEQEESEKELEKREKELEEREKELEEKEKEATANKESEKKEVAAKPKKKTEKKEVAAKAKKKPKKKEATETNSQQQAVSMAENYISYTAFSKSGLIEQLEFEGFNNTDATYGAENISVDWKQQAVKMAENYLDYSAFSKSGLIEQLVFEGFSNEFATYAANEVGL